ncbi:c-type cytochrome [Thalassomonas actiniarum]|uniref:C-type cytochrome n=1 Tax=Thalassomonas actiniarum TaxID=485447 RepID=A0AAE9YVW1_9GAMM|nr:c-type cytochrome [Thalassomonas actiniarum]WDE01309.1 c-type cytochrome [Thalassomonas actiniarum]
MKTLLSLLLISLAVLTACDLGPGAPRGFSLPEGNIEAGKTAFLKYQCLSCHQLEGISQQGITNNPELNVKLGGKSPQVKTYAELVTAVINPSHKFAKSYPLSAIQHEGKSKMKVFNEVMTVQELIDLVWFLQPHYELIPYQHTSYRIYGN